MVGDLRGRAHGGSAVVEVAVGADGDGHAQPTYRLDWRLGPLARALALDWAAEGIRVNAVCPGIVDTPMLDALIAQTSEPDRTRREFETAQPLGRLATPAECAAAALFLASPAASFVTGVALPVDGGFTAQ